jgi:hypothetical protein
MKITRVLGLIKVSLLFSVLMLMAGTVAAQSRIEGKLEVKGVPYPLTQVYAFAQDGFFDKSKLDVTVLFCDAVLPPAAVRDEFARDALVKDGKVHCVLQVISAVKQVAHFEVLGKGFGRIQGASTEHVFEAKIFDGKTINGRSRTNGPQKTMMDNTPYHYDITFNAAIEPKK